MATNASTVTASNVAGTHELRHASVGVFAGKTGRPIDAAVGAPHLKTASTTCSSSSDPRPPINPPPPPPFSSIKDKVERVRFSKDGGVLQLTAVDGRRAHLLRRPPAGWNPSRLSPAGAVRPAGSPLVRAPLRPTARPAAISGSREAARARPPTGCSASAGSRVPSSCAECAVSAPLPRLSRAPSASSARRCRVLDAGLPPCAADAVAAAQDEAAGAAPARLRAGAHLRARLRLASMSLRKDPKRRRLLATPSLPPPPPTAAAEATGGGRYVDASGEPEQKMCPCNAGICLVRESVRCPMQVLAAVTDGEAGDPAIYDVGSGAGACRRAGQGRADADTEAGGARGHGGRRSARTLPRFERPQLKRVLLELFLAPTDPAEFPWRWCWW